MKEINKNICMNCKFFIKTIDGEAFYLCSLPNMFKNECPQNQKKNDNRIFKKSDL